jgi:hypothetical protein
MKKPQLELGFGTVKPKNSLPNLTLLGLSAASQQLLTLSPVDCTHLADNLVWEER